MSAITVRPTDAGFPIEATIQFGTGFDPEGATAVLDVDGDPARLMALAAGVASYVISAGEFRAGFNPARIHVTKDGVTVTTEDFVIIV